MAPFASLLQYRTIRPYVRLAHIVDAPMAVTNRYIYEHEMIFILEGEGTIVTDSGESAYGNRCRGRVGDSRITIVIACSNTLSLPLFLLFG